MRRESRVHSVFATGMQYALRLGLFTISFALSVAVDAKAQYQNVPHEERGHEPESFLATPSGGTCKVDGAAGVDRNLDDGAYLKSGATLVLDGKDSVLGYCSLYIYGAFWGDYTRWMDSLTMDTIAPDTSGHQVTYGTNHYQAFDTRDGTTWGFAPAYPWTVGTWQFNFQGHSQPTGCNFVIDSPVVTKYVNVLACEPKFNKENNIGPDIHINNQTVVVYVPSSMTTGQTTTNIYQDVADAATDWNNLVGAATGVNLIPSTTACGGPNCIKLSEDSLPGLCAKNQLRTNSGLLTGNPQDLILTTGDPNFTTPIPSWRNSADSALRRTLAHELGHLLGLDHPNQYAPYCNAASAGVMLSPATTCDGATSYYTPTINDYLPVVKSVFSPSASKKTCGW